MKYTGGKGHQLGTVTPLPQTTFRELVRDVLACPVPLPLTYAEFHALPKKDSDAAMDQDRAKRTGYLTPGYVDGGSRRLEAITRCNLCFLDVDDVQQATGILARGNRLVNDLAPFSFALYRTASSTPDAPRLRVVVECDSLPVASYRTAVAYVASLLRLPSTNKESNVASQPMFLPVLFRDQSPDNEHPLLHSRTDGRALTVADLPPSVGIQTGGSASGGTNSADWSPTPSVGITDEEFEHLCPAVDAVTLDDAREALKHLNPDMDRADWITVAAGLKHQFGDEGLDLWDEWSRTGSKYQGDTEAQWRSLRESPRGRAPVTIRSVLKQAREAGWKADTLAEKCYAATRDWLSDPSRSDLELIKEGVARIAATPLLSPVEEGVLLGKLAKLLKKHDAGISRTDLIKGLRKAKSDLAGKGGDSDEAPKDADLPEWLRGVAYVSDENVFFRHSTGQKWSVDSFNNAFSRYLVAGGEDESGGRPATLPQHFALNVSKIKVCDHFNYAPDAPESVYVERDKRWFVNTYRASFTNPTQFRAKQVGEAVWNHTKTQFGDRPESRFLIDWMAYVVQNAGAKVLWAPVLQGSPGSGKSLYYTLMGLALGESNVKLVKGNVVANTDWNDWAANTQLVCLNEVRFTGKSRFEIMDKLKDLITDPVIPINQKRADARNVRNFANYLITTNYQDALALDESDRRYFPLFAKQQNKEEVARVWPHPYFPDLYALIKDNAGALRCWLLDWDVSDDFSPTYCPASGDRKHMIQHTSSPLRRAVEDAIADNDNPLVAADVLSTRVLRDKIEVDRGVERFNDQQLSHVLRDLGYVNAGRVRLADGDRHRLWCRGVSEDVAESIAVSRSAGEESVL